MGSANADQMKSLRIPRKVRQGEVPTYLAQMKKEDQQRKERETEAEQQKELRNRTLETTDLQ